MKLTILLFSILISFNSYGKWTEIGSAEGNVFYIDTDRIKEHSGYVYWWDMIDLLKSNQWGDMSVQLYKQGDCGVNRIKTLSYNYYKHPMGVGTNGTDNTPNEWDYPLPKSMSEVVLNYACNYVK
jgi:hypothetical protein